METVFIGIMLLAIVGLFFMNSRARKRQQESLAFRDRLQPGAEVMTTAGLFATVVALQDDDKVVLSTGPGQESVWLKAALAKQIDPTETTVGDDVDDADDVHEIGTAEPDAAPEADASGADRPTDRPTDADGR